MQKASAIRYSQDKSNATLAAGWETISQRDARNGKKAIDQTIWPFCIWIDLLSLDIVECPWIGQQIFTNPKLVAFQSKQKMPLQSQPLPQSQQKMPSPQHSPLQSQPLPQSQQNVSLQPLPQSQQNESLQSQPPPQSQSRMPSPQYSPLESPSQSQPSSPTPKKTSSK